MRLWTLHPCYLDRRGLVALWREALLAQAVLAGNTRGYRHHPQLSRFNTAQRPLAAIAGYLREVRTEADRRGYRFDAERITSQETSEPLVATTGQLEFEWKHLRLKLQHRDAEWLARLRQVRPLQPHPLFVIVAGPKEAWERGV